MALFCHVIDFLENLLLLETWLGISMSRMVMRMFGNDDGHVGEVRIDRLKNYKHGLAWNFIGNDLTRGLNNPINDM